MKLTLRKRESGNFEVEDMSLPGSPPCGVGRTMMEAIGSFFHNNQTRLGIEFEVEDSAWPTELRRRRRELSKR